MKIKLCMFLVCGFMFLRPVCCSAQYLNGEWALKSTTCGSKDSSATKVLTFFAPLTPPDLVVIFTDKEMVIKDTAGTNAKECSYEHYEKKGTIHVICKDGPTDFKVEQLNRDIILTDNVDHICITLRRKKQFLNGHSSPSVKHPTPVP